LEKCTDSKKNGGKFGFNGPLSKCTHIYSESFTLVASTHSQDVNKNLFSRRNQTKREKKHTAVAREWRASGWFIQDFYQLIFK
jgi:hypothetical protein